MLLLEDKLKIELDVNFSSEISKQFKQNIQRNHYIIKTMLKQRQCLLLNQNVGFQL